MLYIINVADAVCETCIPKQMYGMWLGKTCVQCTTVGCQWWKRDELVGKWKVENQVKENQVKEKCSAMQQNKMALFGPRVTLPLVISGRSRSRRKKNRKAEGDSDAAVPRSTV